MSFLAERTLFPAFGIEGGKDGAPGELRINGEKTDPKKQYVVNKGDTVSLGTPGGGGHGDPRQRIPRRSRPISRRLCDGSSAYG